MAHAGGRPLKFKSVEELEVRINDYFKSLWAEVWEHQYDSDKKKKVWIQLLDKDDEPMMEMKESPSITGLAIFLDTSRETLINYQCKDEYFDTIKKAKDMCEYYAEKDASQGKINPILGIFKLKNFGWVDKVEVGIEQLESSRSIPDLISDAKSKVIELEKLTAAE